MSYPVVHPSDTQHDNVAAGTSSYDIDLPANYNAGDLLVLMVATGNNLTIPAGQNQPPNPSRYNGPPTGWTDKGSAVQDGSDTELSVWCKVAEGNEGTTVTVTKNTTAGAVTWAAIRISGWSQDIDDVEFATATLFTSSTVNPPSVTASWGVFPNLFLTIGARHIGSAPSAPTGYSNFDYERSAGISGPVAWASKAATAASDDPDVFTNLAGGIGQTLVIKGLPEGGGGPHALGSIQLDTFGRTTLTTPELEAKKFLWRVPSTAANGTAGRMVVFQASGSTVTGLIAEGAVTAAGGNFDLPLPSTDTVADGTKRFALIHNWNGVTGTNSISGGACIATKMIIKAT